MVAPTADGRTYCSMYGKNRTIIYLPDRLKEALERRAVQQRCEAEVVREALEVAPSSYQAPEPGFPIFESDEVRGRAVNRLSVRVRRGLIRGESHPRPLQNRT